MTKRICLIEKCPGVFKGSRGLCRTHYSSVLSMVRKKKYTWEELEKLGMCFPPIRKYTIPIFEKLFLRMLNKRIKMVELAESLIK